MSPASRPVPLLVLLVLSVLLSACDGSGEDAGAVTVVAAPEGGAAAVVPAASGGTLVVTASGPASGAAITIPPGAIDANAMFTIAPIDGPPFFGQVGAVIDIGPDGTRFDPPARVRLPFDASGLPPSVEPATLRIGKVTDTTSVTVLADVRVDTGAGLVSGLTDSLSEFVIVRPDSTALPQPPSADAGMDRRVETGTTVTLDGTASTDPNGDALVYAWSLAARPADSEAVLENATAPRATLTIDEPGSYRVELVVSDGNAESTDTVLIATTDTPPVADAGANATVALGAMVTLDGSGSSDADGDLLDYAWTLTNVPEGSGAALDDSAAVNPTFVADVAGDYRARLVVTANGVESAPARVVVSTRNAPPRADAGRDRSVALGAVVVLDGSGSTDPDGDRLGFVWSLAERPAGSAATLDNAATLMPSFVADVAGTWLVQLAVDDGEFLATDTLVVTTTNGAPTAAAGADMSLPVGTTATLDGRDSTDPDGDALGYDWMLVSRPEGSTASLVAAGTATPMLTLDVAGTFVVQLVVDDGARVSAPDQVVLRSLDENTPPMADAGADREVAVGASVELDGAGSMDADGDGLSYAWAIVSAPADSTVTLAAATTPVATLVPDLPGIYLLQLIVDDGRAQSAASTVMITALASESAPIADAGADRTVEVGATLALDGSGSSDPDGDTLGFSWTIESRPEASAAQLIDATTATPTFAADVAGIFVLALVVDDGDRSSTPATVTVTALDAVALAAPASFERCGDGIDNDGDGLADDADPACAAGCDLDGDGLAGVQCGGGDVDDGDASRYPGAPELCGNFVDDDLDGEVDEACLASGIALGPGGATVLAGDALPLAVVVAAGARTTAWRYAVDGVDGGDDGIGRVRSTGPDDALFTAPIVTTVRTVTVTATDPEDSARTSSATVTVVPPNGPVRIESAGAPIALGGARTFRAVMEVPGIGEVPVRAGAWFVNDVAGGDPQVGRIDQLGDYRAPRALPGPATVDLEVGVALAASGPVVASAPFLLARLETTPKLVREVAPGAAGNITATLVRSDGMRVTVPAAELQFRSQRPGRAAVDGNGALTIGDELGRTMISVTHAASGATGRTIVESRTDVRIVPDFVSRSDARAGVQRSGEAVTEIEYTRAGARFSWLPGVELLRGPDAGDRVAGIGGSVTLQGDDAGLLFYDESDGLPDLSTATAAVERSTGLVTIGRVPGAVELAARYDDGVIQRTARTTIIYTRPVLEVEFQGSESFSTMEVVRTEFVRFTVTARNPRPDSDFLDDVEVRVGTADAAVFTSAVNVDVRSGFATPFGPFNRVRRLATLTLTLAGTESRVTPAATGAFMALPPNSGAVDFLFTPATDRDAPGTVVSVPVRDPQLGSAGCGTGPVGITAGVSRNGLAARPIVRGSWSQVFHAGPDTPPRASVLELVHASNVFGFAKNDQAIWEVTGPNGPFEPRVAMPVGWLPLTFPEVGSYTVDLALENAPETRSRTTFEVVTPESVANVAVEPLLDDDDQLVPRSNQLGAIEIVEAPSQRRWRPGEQFTVKLRTFDADGTPGLIGRLVELRRFQFDGTLGGTFFERHLVLPRVRRRSGPRIFVDSSVPTFAADGTLTYELTITDADPGGDDLVLEFEPRVDLRFADADDPALAGLPREIREERNNVTTVVTPAPFGVADFSDPLDAGYVDSCLFLDGFGVVASPRELPVASERVRTAVADGVLEPGADRLRFSLRGAGAGFADALGSGVASIDVGTGVSIEATTVEADGSITVEATTEPTLGSGDLGERELVLTLADGSEWRGDVTLFRSEISVPDDVRTPDLPLNAAHEDLPVASQVFRVGSPDDPFTGAATALDLTLRPSVAAGQFFMGLEAEAPIVSFRRRAGGGQLDVTETRLLSRHSAVVSVYGNRADNARLERDVERLVPGRDLLPDLVSREEDAEILVAGSGGNIADVFRFTAFNIVTEAVVGEASGTLAPLDFDPSRRGIGDIYQRYSQPLSRLDPEDFAATGLPERVALHVDNEAGGAVPFDRHQTDTRRDSLDAFIPFAFFAGVLDQGYQRTAFQGVPRLLGRDGRVRAFDGEAPDDPFAVTGRDRRGFGVELDGALYDVTVLGIDEAANGPSIRAMPVVEQVAGAGAPLTAANLLAGIGGTSGGFFDADADSGGSHLVLAKTPAQDVPLVVGAYLLEGGPEDQPSVFGGAENDLFDIALRRQAAPPRRVTTDDGQMFQTSKVPLHNELNPILGRFPRRAHTFGRDFDRKGPVRTSLAARTAYRVTTDPVIADPLTFRSALVLGERPGPDDDIAVRLTTQSIGDEAANVKIAADFVSDLIVDTIYSTLLGAATGGSYVAACGGSLGDSFRNALISKTFNARLDQAKAGVLDDIAPGLSDRLAIGKIGTLYSVAYSGQEVVKGSGVEFSLNDAIAGNTISRRTPRGVKINFANPREVLLCSVLNAPKNQLKAAIKRQYSVEDLGGNGSAEAVVYKAATLVVPRDAMRSETGSPSVTFSAVRRIELLPDEPFGVDLADRPDLARYATDPAVESDAALLARARREQRVSATREAATDFLRRAAVNSVIRTPASSGPGASVGDRYRLRAIDLPRLAGTMIPGDASDGGTPVVDFELEKGLTELTVILTSVAAAGRSNANATARAAIRNEGVDVIPVGTVLTRTE